jgi:Domain of unknown function (DUF6048)
MLRIFVYSISLLFLSGCILPGANAQDTIPIPLKIKIGLEVSGPAIYYTDKNILNEEGYVSVDLNEKRSVFFAAGYSDYKYSQYNYSYRNHGSFVRLGMDFNLLKADKSLGKYWAGIGLRYGLSRFTTEVPFLEKDNYWGSYITSLGRKTNWAHFVEVSPGVRAELLNHFSIGWAISLRALVYSGTGKNLKPVYFPGFGNGTKTIATGLSYFIVWNIPYKRINAIMKKEAKQEEDNTDTDTDNSNKTNNASGNKTQGNSIRQ